MSLRPTCIRNQSTPPFSQYTAHTRAAQAYVLDSISNFSPAEVTYPTSSIPHDKASRYLPVLWSMSSKKTCQRRPKILIPNLPRTISFSDDYSRPSSEQTMSHTLLLARFRMQQNWQVGPLRAHAILRTRGGFDSCLTSNAGDYDALH